MRGIIRNISGGCAAPTVIMSREGAAENSENCSASVTITAGDYSRNLGGLCGYVDEGRVTEVVIWKCYATGAVTGGYQSFCLGGLCGWNQNIISNVTLPVPSAAIIHNILAACAAETMTPSMKVLPGVKFKDTRLLEGWSGRNKGSIRDCYATGTVSGTEGSVDYGGLKWDD